VPRGSWSKEGNIRNYILHLSNSLRITKLDDWYRVSTAQIQSVGGQSIVERNGGLYAVLSKLYPDHPWKADMFFNRAKKASQRWLKLKVEELLPGTSKKFLLLT
jgi:hypothetical protein